MLMYSHDTSGNMVARTVESVSPPQITGQPVQQIVEPGQVATFSVVVADAHEATFQWRRNGTIIVDGANIRGTSEDSLVLIDVSAADVGAYSVLVANSVGTVTSDPVQLRLDSDGDGLPDDFEGSTFGNVTIVESEGDLDHDGISNLDEFLDDTEFRSNTSAKPRLIAYSDAGGS